MAKPFIHACASAKKYGGKAEDYLPLHEFMDSSKGAIADNRHRALTHNAWFIMFVIPRVFGETMKNSAGRVVSTRDVAEDHVMQDYRGFIPTAQDFLQEVPMRPWMQNGKGKPPSCTAILEEDCVTYD